MDLNIQTNAGRWEKRIKKKLHENEKKDNSYYLEPFLYIFQIPPLTKFHYHVI